MIQGACYLFVQRIRCKEHTKSAQAREEWLPHLVEGMEWIPIFGKKIVELELPGKNKTPPMVHG